MCLIVKIFAYIKRYMNSQQINMPTNWEYRTFLQINAKTIMKKNATQDMNATGTNPYSASSAQPRAFNGDLTDVYNKDVKFKSRLISPSIHTTKF